MNSESKDFKIIAIEGDSAQSPSINSQTMCSYLQVTKSIFLP